MNYIDSLLAKIPAFDVNPYIKYMWENITFESILKFSVIYFFIVWIAVIIWVIKDISNRTDSVILQIISILIVLLLTPFWVFLYLIIRPWKTVFEKYYEEIEDNLEWLSSIIKERIEKKKVKKTKCFNCEEKIEVDFSFCPSCKEKLKEECNTCKKDIRTSWEICPYCWSEKEEKLKQIEITPNSNVIQKIEIELKKEKDKIEWLLDNDPEKKES